MNEKAKVVADFDTVLASFQSDEAVESQPEESVGPLVKFMLKISINDIIKV